MLLVAVTSACSAAPISSEARPAAVVPSSHDAWHDGDAPAAGHASQALGEEAAACPEPEREGERGGQQSATRRLRRLHIALHHDLPSREDYLALREMEQAQRADFLARRTDELLADPRFYERMVAFARHWVSLPPNVGNVMAGAYDQHQRAHLRVCPEGTLHAGAYTNLYEPRQTSCNGTAIPRSGSDDPVDAPALVRDVEPWWAPGTEVRVVGRFALPDRFVRDPSGRLIDCGVEGRHGSDAGSDCGCGPNLIYCTDLSEHGEFDIDSPVSTHRQAWEEPARLFAHLVWHDRSLAEWISGDRSVAPRRLQGAYVRHGRIALGYDDERAARLDADQSWWRSDDWSTVADPLHDPTDPLAWSEFAIASRHPLLVEDRHVTFDPRVEPPESLRGIPSAGMLTSLGVTGNWRRERVRGARLLEVLACDDFTPPPSHLDFVPYRRDPGAEGSCQHCHARIDPASIHFKRFSFVDADSTYAMLGLAHHRRDGWRDLESQPWPRIRRLWDHDMRMTPVSASRMAEVPDSAFIDFLPPDQRLYGQVSDGTIGPLGFAKLILASGAFDRCVVRRLHETIVGRDIDPQRESGYLRALVRRFVDGDRRVRDFVRVLVDAPSFERGL